VDIPKDEFDKNLRLFVLFRTLQVLGAYGFRGYFEKKPHFLQSVPFAIDNLRKLIVKPFYEVSVYAGGFGEAYKDEAAAGFEKRYKTCCHIFSFAYKKGIPQDDSGNGGGYVFDCRAVENPGKYEHFRQFNGLDKEVEKFLEDEGSVTKFLGNVYDLVDSHVKKFMERKFTHMMVSFGCTGGQHRSVYCAQHLATAYL
jgi:hypothetical protein